MTESSNNPVTEGASTPKEAEAPAAATTDNDELNRAKRAAAEVSKELKATKAENEALRKQAAERDGDYKAIAEESERKAQEAQRKADEAEARVAGIERKNRALVHATGVFAVPQAVVDLLLARDPEALDDDKTAKAAVDALAKQGALAVVGQRSQSAAIGDKGASGAGGLNAAIRQAAGRF